MSTTETLGSSQTIEVFKKYVIPNYGRFPVNLVRGEGSSVWDSEGNRYLDLFPGWGCNLLGHCPEPVVRAVQEQVSRLIHVPNTWYTESQGKWAQLLSEHSFGGQAFFCNSGTEANEAAIKLARLHAAPSRYKIITFEGGFHGRTFGATTATAQPKYHEGIGPLMAGFVYAPYDDLEAVRKLVDEETCAILVEPIQGEGGIRIPSVEFLQGLRDLATANELLLMFDEVQTGCGRTGHLLCELLLSSRQLEQATSSRRQGGMASRRTVSSAGLHRDQPVRVAPEGCRVLQRPGHNGAVDQRGEARSQLDTTLVPRLRGQSSAALTVCLGV